MSQINILDYVKCVYEQYLQLLEKNNKTEIQKYKTSLKHAIATLEYEIEDEKYLLNNKEEIKDTITLTDNFNYNTLVKLCLFSYLHYQIKN
jgi:hypothetical protein